MTRPIAMARKHFSQVRNSISKFQRQRWAMRSELLLVVIPWLRAAAVLLWVKLRLCQSIIDLLIWLMEASKALWDGPIFFIVFSRPTTIQLTTLWWTLASQRPPLFQEPNTARFIMTADTSSSWNRCQTLFSTPLEPWTLISRTTLQTSSSNPM